MFRNRFKKIHHRNVIFVHHKESKKLIFRDKKSPENKTFSYPFSQVYIVRNQTTQLNRFKAIIFS